MASKFTEFLIRVSEDPARLDELKRNPDAVLATTDLTPAERVLIKSANPVLIREAIVTDLPQTAAADGGTVVVVVVVVVV